MTLTEDIQVTKQFSDQCNCRSGDTWTFLLSDTANNLRRMKNEKQLPTYLKGFYNLNMHTKV